MSIFNFRWCGERKMPNITLTWSTSDFATLLRIRRMRCILKKEIKTISIADVTGAGWRWGYMSDCISTGRTRTTGAGLCRLRSRRMIAEQGEVAAFASTGEDMPSLPAIFYLMKWRRVDKIDGVAIMVNICRLPLAYIFKLFLFMGSVYLKIRELAQHRQEDRQAVLPAFITLNCSPDCSVSFDFIVIKPGRNRGSGAARWLVFQPAFLS